MSTVQATEGETLNFDLTPEQRDIRTMVREFAEAEIAPIASEIDETHRFPEENVDRKSTRLNSSHIQKSRMPSSA